MSLPAVVCTLWIQEWLGMAGLQVSVLATVRGCRMVSPLSIQGGNPGPAQII